jgi:hypothetical protein
MRSSGLKLHNLISIFAQIEPRPHLWGRTILAAAYFPAGSARSPGSIDAFENQLGAFRCVTSSDSKAWPGRRQNGAGHSTIISVRDHQRCKRAKSGSLSRLPPATAELSKGYFDYIFAEHRYTVVWPLSLPKSRPPFPTSVRSATGELARVVHQPASMHFRIERSDCGPLRESPRRLDDQI